MMKRVELTDEEWVEFHRYLKAHSRVYVGASEQCRRFINAVLWVLRSGGQWRLLPAEMGRWNSVFKRFSRWSQHGVWSGLLAHVSVCADREHILMDSTIVRAHACAAGAKKVRQQMKRWVALAVGFQPKCMR